MFYRAQEPGKAKDVVAVQVRDENLGDPARPDSALLQLDLGAFSTIEEPHLSVVVLHCDAGDASCWCREAWGRPEKHYSHPLGRKDRNVYFRQWWKLALKIWILFEKFESIHTKMYLAILRSQSIFQPIYFKGSKSQASMIKIKPTIAISYKDWLQ